MKKGWMEGAGQKVEIMTNENVRGVFRLISDLLIKRLNLRRAVINQRLFTITEG
jgi:hypothetical protein